MKQVPFKCCLGHITIREFRKTEQTYSKDICGKEVIIEVEVINTMKSNGVRYTKICNIGTKKCEEMAVRF